MSERGKRKSRGASKAAGSNRERERERALKLLALLGTSHKRSSGRYGVSLIQIDADTISTASWLCGCTYTDARANLISKPKRMYPLQSRLCRKLLPPLGLFRRFDRVSLTEAAPSIRKKEEVGAACCVRRSRLLWQIRDSTPLPPSRFASNFSRGYNTYVR